MSDTKRLRAVVLTSGVTYDDIETIKEAAREIEAQAKEIERLRKLIQDALDDQEGDWDFLKWNLIRGLEAAS